MLMEVVGLNLVKLGVEGTHMVLTSQPQFIATANGHVGNSVAGQGSFTILAAVVTFKFVAIKTVETVHSGDPNETAVVLYYFEYVTMTEAIFKVINFELVLGGLGNEGNSDPQTPDHPTTNPYTYPILHV